MQLESIEIGRVTGEHGFSVQCETIAGLNKHNEQTSSRGKLDRIKRVLGARRDDDELK